MKVFTLIGALALGTFAASAQATVDASKVQYSVGEGENILPVMIRFNEGVVYSGETRQHLDNIVWGYKYGASLPTPVAVLNAIAAADPRLEVTAESNNVTSIGFDIDGDGTISTPKDNLAASTDSKAWNASVENDVLTFSYGTPQAGPMPYVFYVPQPNVSGIYMPETIYLSLSDTEKYLPFMLQKEIAAARFSTPTFSMYSDEELTTTDRTIISGIAGQANYNAGLITYTGTAVGEIYLKASCMTYNPYRADYSTTAKVVVAEPRVPVTAIYFPQETLSMGLKQTVTDNKVVIEPENATFTKLTLTSSDTKIVTIASATGNITSTATPGSATLTAQYTYKPELTSICEVTTELKNPVTSLTIMGLDPEATEINLYPKHLIGLRAEIEPANADIKDVNVEFILADDVETDQAGRPLNAEGKPVMSMYKVNYWDENNSRIQFQELSGHYPGSGLAKVKISTTDGTNLTKEYTVNVIEPDRTPLDGGYEDGTIILNEEWYGHTNGGMNYLTADRDIIYQAYERENPFQSFGCTSQFATIWGGKLLVSSKQPADGGDPLPGGGELVIVDAKTLKRTGSIMELKYGDESRADGRAIAGAGLNKIYQGSTNGIYIIDIENAAIIGKVGGLEGDGELYEGQVGDMINAGRYVFGIKQQTGVFIIDTTIDAIVKVIPETGIQGVTQSADGNVWYATTTESQTNFVCLNPTTFEELKRVILPAANGTVACSWGAWRSTNLFASKNENVLWFLTGAGGITGGGSSIYKWNTDESLENITPFFQLNGLEGSNSRTSQGFYATQGYDSRSNTLIVFTVDGGSSGHYRYAWTHFVNGDTGEIEKTIALEPYYWFQSMPVFPDKYPATFAEELLAGITLDIADEPKAIDLSELVTDKDNIDSNIMFSLASAQDADSPIETVLDGKTLTITPKATGTAKVKVSALSNGRLTEEELTVNVSDMSGIDAVLTGTVSVVVKGHNLEIRGAEGRTIVIYNTMGQIVGNAFADSQVCTANVGLTSGIYVVKCGQQSFKVIVK
ncbi:MAG: DUF5074 domain-containing protein [Muribaculum sp.]|nr:DUF5074 domain-containing protein [Muribaculum sp.]